MKAYIMPDKVAEFKKKALNASKHLEHEPKMTFSEPMLKEEVTIHNFGEDGYKKYKRMVEVVEVEIEDITSGDWKLVADVLYRDQIIAMVDAGLYKSIPENLGLTYMKCDYCGRKESERREAHIVHNTKTGEWKQIGTSCGKKMFRSGDICKYFLDLYKVIDMCGGCTSDGFGGWCARIPDTTWLQGFNIESLIPSVVSYRKKHGEKWERPIYDDRGYKLDEGTTGIFKSEFLSGELDGEIDEAFNRKIKEYVNSLPYDMYGEEIDDEGFNTKIKRAFENEFIQLHEIYTVFFAIDKYERSLTIGDWHKLTECYKKGDYVDFIGATVIDKELVEGYYGWSHLVRFEYNGVVFVKSFSNWDSTERSYKREDGKFYFSAPIDYVNDYKREIRLCGSCRKLKNQKS